jgi:NADH:ubiquinone oxidoreductase subunit 3 (subunit A)
METMLNSYAYIALFVIVAVGFALIPLGLSALIQTRKPNPVKNETYECGMETIGSAWVQYRVGFYLYALLFVVFDVEAMFLYPWAVIYRHSNLGLPLLGEAALFIGVLVLGLSYAWKKKALLWK